MDNSGIFIYFKVCSIDEAFINGQNIKLLQIKDTCGFEPRSLL